MRDELELALVNDFAPWFDGYLLTARSSLMAFGFECGDGWEPLIRRLCESFRATNPPDDFRVEQVKEKYGGLRFYCSSASDAMYDLISLAEMESYRTCELCGSTDDVTSEGSWIVTRCKGCRDAAQSKG